MNLKIKYILLFVPAFFIFCYPVINSGYYGDDSLHSFISSVMAERNLSFFDQYIINFKAFLPGRISILHLHQWVFLLFTDLVIYKIYVSFMVCMALVSTYLVGTAMLKDSSLPLLTIIFILLISIQFREYGDSVLTFHAATSTNLTLLNLSILCFIKYFDSKTRVWIIGSVTLFIVTCLSYELMYPFFIIYYFIALVFGKSNYRNAVKYLILFLAPVAILTIPNILSRLVIDIPKDVSDPNFHKAYEISIDLGAIALTFVKEIVASLPLSNLIINPFSSLSIENLILVSKTWILFLISIAVLLTTIFYYSLKNVKEQIVSSVNKESTRGQFLFALFALMLLVFPNGIIALSPKYQSEIIWGTGYTSIYFGYFGIGIFASMAIYTLIKRFSARWIIFTVSILLGTAAVANFASNNKTVEITNTFWKNPRTVAEEALRKGIMAGVENRTAYMFINSNYPWDVTSFIHKYSQKFLAQEQYTGSEGRYFGSQVAGNFLIADGKVKNNSKFSPKANLALNKYLVDEMSGNYNFDMRGDKNVYYFDYYADSVRSGYALLAEVQKIYLSNVQINGLASDRVKIYMRIPEHRGVYSMMSATFLALDPASLKPVNNITIQENQFKIISQGSGWKLLEISADPNKYLIDVKSVRLNTSQKIYQTSLFPKSLQEKRDFKFNVDRKSEILHVGFSAPFDYSHIALDPIKLGEEFSIVLKARVSENTVHAPYAHILGNHPGKNNFEGFVLQKKPTGEDIYDLHIGTGTVWKHISDFTLRPGKDSFIAVSFSKGKVTTVFDNEIKTINIEERLRNSEMPLYMGNFVGKDRPFSGQIKELLISNTALTNDDLLEFQKNSK